jgi:cytochrome P450
MSSDGPRIDLIDVANFAGSQPHDQFTWLREHDPVHWHEQTDGPGFWAITRFEDVKTVGRDAETFSSKPTIMMNDPSGENGGLGEHEMMLMTDPPVHTNMRRLISRDFTPKAVQVLRPRVAELATRIVDAVCERGSADLVSDLAGEMPSFVIAEVLGIPLEAGRDLYQATEALHSSTDAVGQDAQRAAFERMFMYSQDVYARKRAEPSNDLGSLLANGAIDGKENDSIDFFLWFLLLVDAGGDTTRNLVGGGMHALFEHRDQLDALQASLRNDPQFNLNHAIEELLRWTSPVIYMRRTATRDTSISGQRIAAGDKVVMYYGAANRDAACVSDPNRLDLTRTENPHVAFGGGGPHFCLGAHLARLEIAALLREMLTRLPDMEPTGSVKWMQSNFIFGPTTLPISFTPSATVGR